MKLANAILLAIAVLLVLMYVKLTEIEGRLIASGRDSEAIVSSNQALIGANQRLIEGITGLGQQVEDVGQKVLKR